MVNGCHIQPLSFPVEKSMNTLPTVSALKLKLLISTSRHWVVVFTMTNSRWIRACQVADLLFDMQLSTAVVAWLTM